MKTGKILEILESKQDFLKVIVQAEEGKHELKIRKNEAPPMSPGDTMSWDGSIVIWETKNKLSLTPPSTMKRYTEPLNIKKRGNTRPLARLT